MSSPHACISGGQQAVGAGAADAEEGQRGRNQREATNKTQQSTLHMLAWRTRAGARGELTDGQRLQGVEGFDRVERSRASLRRARGVAFATASRTPLTRFWLKRRDVTAARGSFVRAGPMLELDRGSSSTGAKALPSGRDKASKQTAAFMALIALLVGEQAACLPSSGRADDIMLCSRMC